MTSYNPMFLTLSDPGYQINDNTRGGVQSARISLTPARRLKGAFKYYISMFSQILDPPPPALRKRNKHCLRPPTPPKMLT